jgi:formylglycine-generating enzyme required for sulfatase activity
MLTGKHLLGWYRENEKCKLTLVAHLIIQLILKRGRIMTLNVNSFKKTVLFFYLTFSLVLMVFIGCSNTDKNDDTTTASANASTDDATTDFGTTTLPTGIVMKSIPGGTFTMGNNNLMGPYAGSATEHSVTLSSFEMSEAEITNAQYVEFLNSARTAGFIEVTTGTSGPDSGKKLIVGSSIASYSGKVLYSLDGTRVMKDHDDADGDDNPFTGVIEPENPLNIAYIGYNESSDNFYVKDPHSASDFNWYALCDYYDHGAVQGTQDTTKKNDFSNWSELANWTESDPGSASGLPTLQNVKDYPVTFIRWWGAKAFVKFFNAKLPSEAQWEYAAKGGSDFTYAVYDGLSVSDANWNKAEEHPAQHHVRAAISGNANPFGLYNLGGNVWEWIEDNFENYSSSDVTDPVITNDSTLRSWRGGSWNYHQATLETSARYRDEEDRGNDHFGFRIVK